jgi:DNA polymerase III subunit delta
MNYRELFKKLKDNQIEKIYLVYGEETYLKDKYAETLRNTLVLKEFEDLNFHFLDDKNFSVEKVINACETTPFMSERKMVLVKFPDLFSSKQKVLSDHDENELIYYFKKVPKTTCLLFYGGAAIDSRRKIVKEINKNGELIHFQKLEESELKKWIEKTIKNHQKVIKNLELSYFIANIDYMGKNASQQLLDIENEIKKIVSFIGERKEVTKSDIDYVSVFSFQNDIFKLFDAIGRKNAGEALKRLNGMITQGEAIIKILVSLSNYVRNLLKTKLLLEEGYSTSMIASKLGMNSYYITKCAYQSKGFTVKRLKTLLNVFLKIDLMIKSGKLKENIGVEMLVIELINKK